MGYVPLPERINCIYWSTFGKCTKKIDWIDELKYGIKVPWYRKFFKRTCILYSGKKCNMKEEYKRPKPPSPIPF